MADIVENPFVTPEGAARYARGRPFHHPRALDRIFDHLGKSSVARGLDVACGTGLSTIALAGRAEIVVGVDPVESMIHLAKRARNAVYAVAPAELLPFPRHAFDVVTVSSGVHWFDQDAFFAEAERVLQPGGSVAIYDHLFEGAVEEPAIDKWLDQSYAKRYPPPPKAAATDRPVVSTRRFSDHVTFEYDDPIAFTQTQLVSYLLSHSNTITAATEGRETTQQTRAWLVAETAYWFDPPNQRQFLFRGMARCLKKKLSTESDPRPGVA